jgi:hypothetical protein
MATATYHTYAKALNSLGAKAVNLTSDALKVALLSAYTPGTLQATAQTVGDIWSAVTEATGGHGYTTGGQALTSLTLTTTAANSWATTAATSTAYGLGAVVRPSAGNGYLYYAAVAGTSGGSAPTWPTVIGTTVTDGTVTWLNIGTAVTTLTAAAPSWTSTDATGITASYAVIYDSSVGTGTFASASTADVIGYWDFGGSQQATNGGTFAFSATVNLLTAGTS